jgi:hypothetical protein
MKITVTKEDIQRGIRSSACSCPIARACNRQTRPTRVFGVTMRVDTVLGGSQSFDLSRRAQQFIARFDRKKKVKPFSFIVRGLE